MLELDGGLYNDLQAMADQAGISFAQLLTRAIALTAVVHDEMKGGGNSLGFASDPSVFDALIVGIP